MHSIERVRRVHGVRHAAALPAAVLLAAGLVAAACSIGGPPKPTVQADLRACTVGSTQDADDGAHIKSAEQVRPGVVDLTIESPAMGGTAMARLFLPANFESEPAKAWPLLLLLHGATGSHSIWTEVPGAANLMVVAPDGGEYGYYSDWWNGGKGGPPAYDKFHLVELPQLLQRGWCAGTRLAVAGISMGGFGAMSYAGRHPGMFVAAASISGVLDTRLMPWTWADPDLWGNPITNADVWKAHNPAELVSGLRGTALFVSYGNGRAGPFDAAGTLDDLEMRVGEMGDAFTAQLKVQGIPATVDAYGPGTHTGPYFDRELAKALLLIRNALGVPS